MEKEKETVKIEMRNFSGEVVDVIDIDKEKINKGPNTNPLFEHSLPKEMEIRGANGKVIYQGKIEDFGASVSEKE